MGTIRKGILVLDPRTKILLLLGINIFVFTNSHVYAEMLVVAALVILLLLCGVYKTALKSTITYIVLLAIKCWILPFCPEIIMTSLNIVVITFRKLLPCVTLGALLVQTTPIRLLMHAKMALATGSYYPACNYGTIFSYFTRRTTSHQRCDEIEKCTWCFSKIGVYLCTAHVISLDNSR